jgi:AcrR family transcriptional regulator
MGALECIGYDGVTSDAIIDAALDILSESGLSGLTLRPLASRVGVTVPAISARMGSKEQLIARIVDVTARRDRVFQDRWLELAERIAPTNSIARAAIADLAFREWATVQRRHAMLLIELVHLRALQPASSPALEMWLDRSGIFWSTLLFGSPELADLALGYILDETAFTLGAGDNHAYGLLRVLCLQRFVDGLFARGDASGTEIEGLIETLRPPPLPIAAIDDPKRSRIADRAADIIVSQGMEATTHRAVAAAAGVPASTVVYHFGGRDALVVAGLHTVIARFHGVRDRQHAERDQTTDDTARRNLVKATSLIALASVREPSLIPFALDMRRRRGENIVESSLPELGFGEIGNARFDRAAAQVVSIGLFGMRMVAMGRGLSESACYQAAFAALDRWNSARPD